MAPSKNPTGWRRWFSPETYAYQPENGALRVAKKIVVATIGVSVILVGIAMILTPGPAVLVIPAGLAILAVEFEWARRWLRRIKAYVRAAKRRGARTRGSRVKRNEG
jgi:uncharacterized protein (TIGR02611 family)